MSNLTSNSLAAATASAVKNEQFTPTAQVLPRKIVITGSYDPSKTLVVDDVPVQVFSPEDVGNQFGFGFMLHRLAIYAFTGSKGIETWVVPQSEAGGAVAAAGEIDFTGSTGVVAGTLSLYIAGELYAVNLTTAMTVEEIADAVVAVVNANTSSPVVAAKTAVTFEVTLTAKSKTEAGDDITIRFNQKTGEVTPTGITVVITAMTGGVGVATIQDALDGLGTGDGANEKFFTDFIHGNGQDTTSLDAIANYVGQGNTFIGLYDKLVHKPFRALNGDIVLGSGGLTALVALGDGRKLDRANGTIAAPDSPNHPSEIAALAMGAMARINNNLAEQNYVDVVLEGIIPGAIANRWTTEYNNRDTAVKAGISPTFVKNGVVVMQNVATYYHPDNVPVASNGYRSMRNISILQNILYNNFLNFDQEKWKGISIVSDKTFVTNVTSRAKARDVTDVIGDDIKLAQEYGANAWLYDVQFTKDSLKEVGAVTVRVGGDGFVNNPKYILSGEGLIMDTTAIFDTSIAVLQ